MIFATLLLSSLLGVHVYNITDYKKYKKIKNKLPRYYVNKYGELVEPPVRYIDYLNAK